MTEVATGRSAAEQLVGDLLITVSKTEVMQGVTAWRNPKNGFKIVDLENVAHPGKRSSEWLLQARQGIPKAEFEREYGKKWVVYDGKPVYDDYDEDIHMARGAIFAKGRCRLISGWDAGPNDVNLAWALGLAFPQYRAITFIDEYFVDDGDGVDFIEVVRARLALEWFKISGGFSLHVADPSVFTQDNRTRSCFADEMRKHGMPPLPGAVSFADRRKAVNDLMAQHYRSTQEDKIISRWRVHERCSVIREAMGGGYCYPKAAMGVGGDYKPTPLKNKFSHIANAVEYACSKLEASVMTIPFEGRSLPPSGVI